jgi:23S rRNA pseudouridine2605 synthase
VSAPEPPDNPGELHTGERLQKVLARAGLGSRRTAEDLIAAGRVRVDGEVAVLGRRVEPDHQRITVDGVPVSPTGDLVTYVLNKPPGVVSTASDPQGRPTVVELVPGEPRVFPVGRLDADSEGLLVLTNDGELAQRLTHPSHGVDKAYLAEVDGVPTRATLRRLREGIELDDGPTAPAQANLVQSRDGNAAVEIVIHEGRNRQIRRMLDSVGHPVRRLVRTRIGPLADPALAPGSWRRLAHEEIRALYAASDKAAPPAPPEPPTTTPAAAPNGESDPEGLR